MNAFIRSLGQTAPVQLFIRHAGVIAGGFFALGNVQLLVSGKPGEQIMSLWFLAANVLQVMTDKRPGLKVPAGVLFCIGAVILAYNGLGLPGQNAQIFAAFTFFLLGLAMVFETQFQTFATRKAQGGGKVYVLMAGYPVAFTGVIDVLFSTLPLVFAALLRGDMVFLLATLAWLVGGLGVIATDNGVKALLKD